MDPEPAHQRHELFLFTKLTEHFPPDGKQWIQYLSLLSEGFLHTP